LFQNETGEEAPAGPKKPVKLVNAAALVVDFDDMFPLYELLSHAESANPKPVPPQVVEARRSPRRSRCGSLTIYPRLVRPDTFDPMLDEEPQVVASMSNISGSGMGLILGEELPAGMEFDVDWQSGEASVPLRFQVVHSRAVSGGMYRSGARLIHGQLPEEPAVSEVSASHASTMSPAPVIQKIEVQEVEAEQPEAVEMVPVSSSGIMRYEPASYDASEASSQHEAEVPGTFKIANAFGFDKTERLDGATTCGWERSIEMRRVGPRLWVYIHSPGKQNGWGIFVDANQFESALSRVQDAAETPAFVTTLAA
jgi:hypothetical protein